MKKTVVVYKSKYGSTKKYAEWISEALNCDIYENSSIDKSILLNYDVIIYGGGLYASGINGISLISRNYNQLKEKDIIIYTVGLADPNVKEHFGPIIDKNLSEEMKNNIKIFNLRGAIDYKNLKLFHKTLMALLANKVKKLDDSKKTEEDKVMIETYGTKVDFTDKETIKPIISLVEKLCRN